MSSTAIAASLLRRCRVVQQVFLLVVLSVYGNALTTMSTAAAAPAAPSAADKKKIILWNSGTCPYAQRAWIALLEKQVEFEHKIVDLSNKPADFVAKYASAIGATDVSTVRAKVPLLEYGDDTLVVESEDVIKFIGENMGMNDDMYPKQDNDRRRERIESFIKCFENTIQGYYKFMTAANEADADEGKLAFCTALHALAPLIQGPFCLGETFSVAECYAAPWVHRYQVTVPYFRGVTLNQVMLLLHAKSGGGSSSQEDSIEKVMAWMDAVLNRPSVQATNGPDDKLLSTTRGYFIKYVTPNSPAAAAVLQE